MNKRRGVLFGGSGLIGGSIIRYFSLKKRGTVDLRAPSSKKVSLKDCEAIQDYLLEVRPEFVINAAIANIIADPELACEINYFGALRIARAAAALKIPYVHLSSAATLPPGENLDEDQSVALAPHLSNYAKSKLMAEMTLNYMAHEHGLDHTCIRLSIVYGKRDNKIQGFHRLLFTIADESMPFLLTRPGVRHSYSNSHKLPYMIHYLLDNRAEFSGKTFNFVDPEPVELADLALTIRKHLGIGRPKKIFMPYWMARSGKRVLQATLRGLTKVGVKGALPPELMFLGAFYRTQTLSCARLQATGFTDPYPLETVYTRLPELIHHYLTRWSRQHLLNRYDRTLEFDLAVREDFTADPLKMFESVVTDASTPYAELKKCRTTEARETGAEPPQQSSP
jgi:nucleoside-diphosphate-sugar epimerase